MRPQGFHLKGRAIVLLISISFCGSAGFGQSAQTTWVRGKILRDGKYNYPLSKIKVTLVAAAYKNDPKRALRTYTRDDGMYDFRVPPGNYVLAVWTSDKQSKTYSITVRPGVYCDIAPIRI
jgi:hypothetical protein